MERFLNLLDLPDHSKKESRKKKKNIWKEMIRPRNTGKAKKKKKFPNHFQKQSNFIFRQFSEELEAFYRCDKG